RRWAQGFPTQVDDFNRQTAESFGMPASPKKIAEVVLNDFLATLQRRPNVDTY
ncbi:MAG: hypothetical protein QOI61_990, partial [Actinomycetota bacterium]